MVNLSLSSKERVGGKHWIENMIICLSELLVLGRAPGANQKNNFTHHGGVWL